MAKKWRPDIWTMLLLGAIVYVWFRPPAWVSDLDQSLPALQIQLLDGRVINLEQLRGKVVLVNFWATWCPYCRHEMPAMEEFYSDYRDQGFEILALSQDDAAAPVVEFMAKENYHFPVAMADASVAAAFGGVSRLPTSFVIDKRGLVRHKISGQVHYPRLKALVEPLLAE
ncbi:MAG: TlpA family protein disulfide reductase [Gammaproteobacteria bacterium]|nr:TlpA family protein disulfide reductase [Gammaproteobacteria bacterium]MBU1731087.1 TlpA family protein disulfide reductase [Gammaproteobacteria bacterium]MBU1894151.1 TlpA family protein disulfide reductase [Gammaproteobacteria bacterium]